MPKYYELDVICEVFSDVLHISERDIEEILENTPTEDVVPRSEVEKAKQEVAKQIFEEIDNFFPVGISFIKEQIVKSDRKDYKPFAKGQLLCMCHLQEHFEELKKKYIGE